MAYEIIALDIDGTLTNDEKIITPRTKQALETAIKQGKKVVLASGRHPYGVVPYAKQFDLDSLGGYLLCFNGGRIVKFTDGKQETVYSKNLPLEFVPEICHMLKGSNITINTYNDTEILTNEIVNKYSNYEGDILKMPVRKLSNFCEEINFPVNKLLLAGEPDEIEKYEKIFLKHFDGKLDVFKSTPFFLEVMPLGVNKGTSLHYLLQKLNLTKDNLIACGDSFNDMTMVGYAGLGVAMENAEEDLKKIANYVTTSNNDDGVGLVVEKFML